MNEITEAHVFRHRLETDADNSVPRSPPRSAQSLGRAAVEVVALSVLPPVLVVAASYPIVAALILSLSVGGFVVVKQLASGKPTEPLDWESKPGEPDSDRTTVPSD